MRQLPGLPSSVTQPARSLPLKRAWPPGRAVKVLGRSREAGSGPGAGGGAGWVGGAERHRLGAPHLTAMPTRIAARTAPKAVARTLVNELVPFLSSPFFSSSAAG